MTRPTARLRPGGRFAQWRRGPVRGVLLDVDGTVLATDPLPSPAFVDACRGVQDAGVWVGFATGRPPEGLDALRAATGARGPHVTHNGSVVVVDGAPPRVWSLAADAVVELERRLREHGVYAEVFLPDGFAVTDFREEARISWETVSGPPLGPTTGVDLATVASPKITAYLFEPDRLPALLAICAGLPVYVDTSVPPLFGGVVLVNITAPGVSKGSGVVAAAHAAGVTAAEVMVVGDGDNDLPMFAVAGTAVAMGQAAASVQAAAHLVTGTLAEDGAATALLAALDEGGPR